MIISQQMKFSQKLLILPICMIYLYIFLNRHHDLHEDISANCNTLLTTAHDDICVIFQCVGEQKYELNINDALKALCTMKV